MSIIYISLIVNIIVAGYWGIILSFSIKSNPADKVFGLNTVARKILGNLYLAIAIASILPFILPSTLLMIATILLPMQVLYKLLSVITASNKYNPVIISNACIAMLHSVSLYTFFYF